MAGFDFSKLNTVPPQPPVQETPAEEIHTETPEIVTPQGTISEPQTTQVETPPQPETKVDTFIENLNKEFGTQYKDRDEVKKTFGLQKTVDEYQTKLKESESLSKSIEDYKKKIEELEESQDPLKYFSSPNAYIAEQLKIKYPKSNPDTLHKIATADLSKMDDLDVLIKDKQLFVPDAPKEGIIRSVVLKKYGIDPTTPPEEWDEISVAEMKLDAAAAREKIENLKSVIEMPKIVSKEEKLKAEQDALAQKEQVIAPLKETFSKFDKFSYEGFEFDVPSEYQSKLPDMFQSMFINAGMEPNEENLQSAVELRDALFLHQYFPKIKEVIAKEAETKLQAKVDAELHNTQPPNTATLTDQGNVNTLPGAGQFVSDLKSR
jgi:hypothetical protein